MTLTEVGKKIADHLARMEEGQLLPTHGELPVLFKAYAWRAGNRVKVRYKSFWNPS